MDVTDQSSTRKPRHRRLFGIGGLALACSPALFPLWLILRFGVDLTYWDQWSPTFVGLFVKAHQSRLSVWDFFAQHNEHRTTIPRLLYLLIGYFTSGNTVVQMLTGWAAVCGTSMGILVLATRTLVPAGTARRPLERRILVPFFLANTAIFAITQWENWLSGIGLTNLLPMLFITWAMVAATSNLTQWLRFIIAGVLAVLATYSLGNGVLAWPLIGVILAWSGTVSELKSKRWILLAWLGLAIFTCLTYLYSFESGGDKAQLPTSFGLWRFIGFNLAFLGNIFILGTSSFPELDIDIFNGALVLLLLVGSTVYFVHTWRARRDHALAGRMVIWLAIAGFAVGSGLLGSVFRSAVSPAQGASSRYISFSLYGVVALIFLFCIIGQDMRSQVSVRGWNPRRMEHGWERFVAAVLSIYLLLTFFCVPVNLSIARQSWEARLHGKAALLLSAVLPDNPQIAMLVVPDPVRLLVDAPQLDELGYIHPRLIRSKDARAISSGEKLGKAGGMLDQVRDLGNGRVLVTGWAINPRRRAPADGVFLTYENEAGVPTIFIQADVGFNREEIVKTAGNTDLLRCGWSVEIPLTRIPASIHRVKLQAWALDTANGTARLLDGEPVLTK